MFKLEKLYLDPDKDSMLPAGYSETGNALTLFRWDTEEHKPIDGPKEVEAGWQLLLTRGLTRFLNTSMIAEIIERDASSVTFKTQTSIYKLTYIGEKLCATTTPATKSDANSMELSPA